MHVLLALSLLAPLLLMGSCAKTTDTSAKTDEIATTVCRTWLPVYWSPADTDLTIEQAKANNAARRAWGCE